MMNLSLEWKCRKILVSRNRPAGGVGQVTESSSNGQPAVDIHLALCADIYMPVHDRRDVEPQGNAGTVPCRILFAVVKFMRHIRSVIGVESRRLVACVPDSGAEQPHDAVVDSVRG